MKKFFSKIFSYARAHKIISSVIVVAVILEGAAIATGAGKVIVPSYTLAAARLGTISQTVSGTGQVQGVNQISVTPQGSGGQVMAVLVAPGDMVAVGQTLAVLDDRSALLSLQQAKANLESAEASYEKVVDGLTPEQVAANQASVTNATQSLVTELISAYTQTNSTLRTDVDTMFTGANIDPSFSLSFLDSNGNLVTFAPTDIALVAKVNGERAELNTLMPVWQADASSLSLQASTTNLTPHVSLTLTNLQYMANFLNDLSNSVYNVSAQYTKYSSNVSAFKSTVASALQNIDAQIASVTSSNQSLLTAQTNYNVNTAPPTNADVTSAQASLDNAQVSLQTAQNNYADTRVTAPFAGQVGSVGVQVGAIAGGSTAVATLTTTQKIADISLNEVDAATVHVGDLATLTFSALPNITIPATVSQMSLVGTVSSGVVDYDVKLALATSTQGFAQFLGGNGGASGGRRTASSTLATTTAQNFEQNFQTTLTEIKPGMSVTANIITQSHSNTIIIASAAVKSLAGGRGSYVQELPGIATAAGQVTTATKPQNVTVTVGLTNGTQTEILSGVNEGDFIITQTSAGGGATASPAAAATTRAAGGFGGGGFGALGGGGAARAGGGAAAIRAF